MSLCSCIANNYNYHWHIVIFWKWCKLENKTAWVECPYPSWKVELWKSTCTSVFIQGSPLRSSEKLLKDREVHVGRNRQAQTCQSEGVVRKAKKRGVADEVCWREEASRYGASWRNYWVQQVLGWEVALVPNWGRKDGRRDHRSPWKGTHLILTGNLSFSMSRQKRDRRNH